MAKSPREALTSPHDALFKWTFSQRPHAIGLLKATLPASIVAAMDWSTLRVEKGSFVDAALRSRHSDLVLSARMGEGRIYFYILFEQQRDVEALMVFRMGVYMMRLWEQIVGDQPRIQLLPPIMPVLIHHSDTGWTTATAFQDIIAGHGPEREAFLPHTRRVNVVPRPGALSTWTLPPWTSAQPRRGARVGVGAAPLRDPLSIEEGSTTFLAPRGARTYVVADRNVPRFADEIPVDFRHRLPHSRLAFRVSIDNGCAMPSSPREAALTW